MPARLPVAPSLGSPPAYSAFDTETLNRPGGGYAVLLSKWTPEGIVHLEFPTRWPQIFDFLKGARRTAYNLDFDVRAIVHDQFLPWRLIEDLALFKRAEWRGYRFAYIQGKFLEVRRGRESFIIYDVKQFYATSLREAAKKYLARTRKREIKKSWYNEMDRCLMDKRRSIILEYAEGDVRALQELTQQLVDSFTRLGIPPRKLVSAASLTKQKYGKVMSAEKPEDRINFLWQRGFYGGRVEIGAMGRVGPANLYDLHSAYPAEIALLRSLQSCALREFGEGEWAWNQDAQYGLYRVRAWVPPEWHWGPLAYRDGEKVIYPVGQVDTWCCLPGIKLLRELKLEFTVQRAWEFTALEIPPLIFEGINDLFLARENPRISLAIKLVLNSIYGCCAEATNYQVESSILDPRAHRQGRRWLRSKSKFGRYTNFVLASAITEAVRCKIFRVLHEFQDRAYYAATDGILISGELPESPEMGAWGIKARGIHAVILGCGRYVFEYPDGELEFNLRGFPVDPDVIARLRRTRRPYCSVPVLATDTLLDWAKGGGIGDLNVLRDVRHTLRLLDDKRHWPRRFGRVADAFTSCLESSPWIMAWKTVDRVPSYMIDSPAAVEAAPGGSPHAAGPHHTAAPAGPACAARATSATSAA